MIDVAAPGAASPSRSKKWPQTEDGAPFYVNIMGDPRVYRGPVHGRRNSPAVAPGAPPSASIVKRKKRPSRLKLQSIHELHKSVHVERAFEPVLIHLYLEEQDVEPVSRQDQLLQTDQFLPVAPEPRYVPAKIGLDAGTQVDPESGDLFNFDEAIDPTIRVIVSKTLEQALIEVRMEVELAQITARKQAAEKSQQERDQAMAELERRTAEENAETERLVKAEKERVRRETVILEKTKSRHLACHYLSSIQSTVYNSLLQRGFLYDPVEAEVADIAVSWLSHAVAKRLRLRSEVHHQILDDLVRNALEIFTRNCQMQSDRAELHREQRKALERLRAVVVKLHLRLPDMDGRILGPVAVKNGQTIAEAQIAVRNWLKRHAPELAEELAESPMQFRLDGVLLSDNSVIMDIGLSSLSTLDLSLVKD